MEKTNVTEIEINKKPFNVNDLQLISGVLGQPSQPAGVKDIRVIDGIVNLINKSIPNKPTRPERLDDGKNYDEKEYQEAVAKWQIEAQSFQDKEVDIPFTNLHLGIIKHRISKFNGFSTDGESRKRVIELADKLNIN